eukprot:scaffold204276_cov13-Prasinocladus_malaysianus.AAC.1
MSQRWAASLIVAARDRAMGCGLQLRVHHEQDIQTLRDELEASRSAEISAERLRLQEEHMTEMDALQVSTVHLSESKKKIDVVIGCVAQHCTCT